MTRRQFFTSSVLNYLLFSSSSKATTLTIKLVSPTPTPFQVRLASPSRVPSRRSLYARISELLRHNKPSAAVSLYQQHVARNIQAHQRRTKPDSAILSTNYKALLRIAQLFRSYGHPQLTVETLGSLQYYMDFIHEQKASPSPSLNTQAAVLFLQACNELAWKPTRQEQALPRSNSVCYHAELGKLLAGLAHGLGPRDSDRKTSFDQTASWPRTLGKRPSGILVRTSDEAKVLEVILGTILKLGEPDWLVSILRETYPRFIAQLGVQLYPLLDTQVTTSPWQLDEIPTGRLVKFLVASYTLSGDLDRAYVVWRFYRCLWNHHIHDRPRDPAPDITLLRALSRSSQSYAKHIRMAKRILEGMQADHVPLEAYGLEGLMDVRYRMRSRWGLRRPHATAFQVLQNLLSQSIGLFLLQWRRPSICDIGIRGSTNQLVQGALQGQRELMSWKYRPNARSFTLTLLSLRSEFRFQASLATRRKCSRGNDFDQVDWGARCPKIRPSPGSHRQLVCQLIALENLNASTWEWPLSQADNPTCFPNRLRLLTPTNLKLCLQLFLCAKDYAGACVVLRHAPSACVDTSRVLFELIIKEVPRSIKNRLLLPDDYDTFLQYAAATQHRHNLQQANMEEPNTAPTPIFIRSLSALSHINHGIELNVLKALEVILRLCEPGRPDPWWQSELAAVYRRLRREQLRMAEIVNQPALSEYTLDFLRTHVARCQYTQVIQGLK